MKPVLSSSASSSLPVSPVPVVPAVPATARIAATAHEPPIAPVLVDPSTTPKRRFDPKLIGALAAVYLIWSSTYLAMRIGVQELPPLGMASLRFAAAGLSLLVIAKQRGAAWPSARDWLRVIPIGALLFVCGNGFVGIAELSVSSGGAAVVCATMPLWTGVLGAISGERPTRREWLSLVLGFLGVIVLMGGPSLAGEPMHIVLIILSPVCWSLGSILARRNAALSKIDTFMSSAMQMIAGSVLLALASLLRGEHFPAHASTGAWLAVVYLFIFGSLVGFTAYNWLLRNARPVVATSYAYVNPVLAVLLGAALSGEALGATTLIANILIVGAIALAFARRRAR